MQCFIFVAFRLSKRTKGLFSLLMSMCVSVCVVLDFIWYLIPGLQGKTVAIQNGKDCDSNYL